MREIVRDGEEKKGERHRRKKRETDRVRDRERGRTKLFPGS